MISTLISVSPTVYFWATGQISFVDILKIAGVGIAVGLVTAIPEALIVGLIGFTGNPNAATVVAASISGALTYLSVSLILGFPSNIGLAFAAASAGATAYERMKED